MLICLLATKRQHDKISTKQCTANSDAYPGAIAPRHCPPLTMHWRGRVYSSIPLPYLPSQVMPSNVMVPALLGTGFLISM